MTSYPKDLKVHNLVIGYIKPCIAHSPKHKKTSEVSSNGTLLLEYGRIFITWSMESPLKHLQNLVPET